MSANLIPITSDGGFSTTGNVVAGNVFVVGSISISGVASPAPTLSGFSSVGALEFTNGNSNVTVTANASSWIFGTDGNLTLPANTFAVNYANGDQVSIGGGATDWANIGNITGGGGPTSIAIGQYAQEVTPGSESVAVGQGAGQNSQGIRAVSIGALSGVYQQGDKAVAVGATSGFDGQGDKAVAVGWDAGYSIQGVEAVAVGAGAGTYIQGNAAVAIGVSAGKSNQGDNSIAIGAGAGSNAQGNNSIILNATGANLNQTVANTFTVAPVRNDIANTGEVMFYNTTSKEVTYGNTLSVSGNVTANNISANTVFHNGTGIAIQSNNWAQLQYTNSALAPTEQTNVGDGSWFYVDPSGAVWESNTTGTIKSVKLGNDGSIIADGNINSPLLFNAALNMQGNTVVQMQYSNGSNVLLNDDDIGTGSWFFLDAGGAWWQSNATGTVKSVNLGNDGSINADGNIAGKDLNMTGNGVFGGNLTVNGTLTYINSTTLSISDPIINLQTGPNGAAPVANSGKDVGTALNYYDTSAKISWMGWDVSNAEIAFGSEVSISAEVVTFTSLANIRSGNANLGNLVTANFFSGNGSGLSSITGTNVSGPVANATYATTAGSATTAGTVTTGAQTNITSVGILDNLAVTGTISTGIITLPNGAVIKDTAGDAVAFGQGAGSNTQGNAAVAVGYNAGQNTQGYYAVAIGFGAGETTQQDFAVAVGANAGLNTQGSTAVAVGYNAGQSSQGASAVAIGQYTGQVGQRENAVAVGTASGALNQGIEAVAVGFSAGQITQGNSAVAIGVSAGENNQGANSVAIGKNAGITSQGNNSIILNATGANLNQTVANTFTVAPVRNDIANTGEVMFYNTTSKEVTYGNTISVAGNISANNISTKTITLPNGAVIKDTVGDAVAFGQDAGGTSQGGSAVAIGRQAGKSSQGAYSVAIGSNAGNNSQGESSLAIGDNAGNTGQGNYAIAVGAYAGRTGQGNNSIILNATGANLNQTTANTFTVAPVRNDTSNIAQVMFYNTTSKEVTYGNTLSVAGTITANSFIGNGSQLTAVIATFATTANSVAGANVSGAVALATSATTAGTANSVAGANVSGAVAFAAVANSVAGSNVSGEVAFAAVANSIAGANVTGTVAFATNATTAGTANSVAGANVIGTVANATNATTAGSANSIAGANVSGAVAFATTANSIAGANVSGAVAFATTANSVAGANVSGAVANATFADTVATVLDNITNGDMDVMTYDGNIKYTSNVTIDVSTGLLKAKLFSGDGSSLTNINVDNINNEASNVSIPVADGNVEVYANGQHWTFTDEGNLLLAGGNGVIQSIANSSLDVLNPNVSTMVFTPDQANSSQALVLDPTSPGHLHLRVPGSDIDHPQANLYLGGEASSFEVGIFNGSVPNLFIHSNNQTWTFDNGGNLTLPNGGKINTYPNGDVDLKAGAGANTYIGLNSNDGNSWMWVDNLGSYIGTNWGPGAKQWTFGADGNLTLPNGTVIKDTAGDAVAFGQDAGGTSQGGAAVAVGYNAGQNSQGASAVAVGVSAGNDTQGGTAVAVGYNAGQSTQGVNAVAIGFRAGQISQGSRAVAIGDEAGSGTKIETFYLSGAVSPSTTLEVGDTTGIVSGMVISGTGFTGGQTVVTVTDSTTVEISAPADSIPSGILFFTSRQGDDAVAVGSGAGSQTQGSSAVAIGLYAGHDTQGSSAVAIGLYAGLDTQGIGAVAVGERAGYTTQGVHSVAVGSGAGRTDQGGNAIAIGAGAGSNSQGVHSVAIGYYAGVTNQANNSIILNATGAYLNQTTANTFTVKPVRQGNTANAMYYNASSGEITYDIASSSEASFSIQNANFVAVAGDRYGVDTTSNSVTATLPAGPATGVAIFFADAGGAYATNNLIINPNGATIMSTSGNMTVSTNNQSVGLFFNGTTWRIYNAG